MLKTRTYKGIWSSQFTLKQFLTVVLGSSYVEYFVRAMGSGFKVVRSLDDYAKDGGKDLFTKMHCVL